jgi:hypothetical protein
LVIAFAYDDSSSRTPFGKRRGRWQGSLSYWYAIQLVVETMEVVSRFCCNAAHAD